MGRKTITTHELKGVRVVGGKSGSRRIGKIRSFVFHPKEKRLIGFIVKRPDILWMFRRKDMFVSLKGYDMIDGRVVVRDEPGATNRRAYKALEVNPDECVLWLGLPIMTVHGEQFGVVGNVTVSQATGKIQSILSDSGAAANTLLGTRDIPGKMIIGFRKGMGVALAVEGQRSDEDEKVECGAVLVSDDVRTVEAEGGVSEKAGAATAVVAEKASRATKKTGAAVNKGAYATGKQLGKAKGMLSNFKKEYNKARHDDEES